MIDPNHLRCVTALVQAVPGAQMVLHTTSGAAVTAGRHPSCEIDSYSLRLLLSGEPTDYPASVCERIERIVLEGSAREIGGGLHLAAPGATVWFATVLPTNVVLDEIREAYADGGPNLLADSDVRVIQDDRLGVTLLEVSSDEVDPIEAAMALAGRLLIAEIEHHPAHL